MQKEFYTVREIADLLGVTVDTIQGYIRRKELIAYRVGDSYRIRKEDLEAFLAKRRTDKPDKD